MAERNMERAEQAIEEAYILTSCLKSESQEHSRIFKRQLVRWLAEALDAEYERGLEMGQELANGGGYWLCQKQEVEPLKKALLKLMVAEYFLGRCCTASECDQANDDLDRAKKGAEEILEKAIGPDWLKENWSLLAGGDGGSDG